MKHVSGSPGLTHKIRLSWKGANKGDKHSCLFGSFVSSGLSLTTAADTGWEKMAKNYTNFPWGRIYGATTFSIMILTITTFSIKGY